MKKWFVNRVEQLPIEMKILVFTGIGGVIFSLFTTLGNLVLGLNIRMVLISIFTGIIGGSAIYFALFKNLYKITSYIALATLILIVYPFMWVNNGGSYGTIAFFMMFNAVFCSLLLRYLNYKIVLSVQILVFYALLYMEYLYPDMIVPYPSEIARLTDIGFAFTLVFLMTFYLIYKIMHKYHENIIELEQIKKEYYCYRIWSSFLLS